ncbi:MAG: hypothetical protein K2L07_11990 [Lachnospiraceae bacterium]|nr:hypothetical protein [Lachnospiraceae bacterium]
MIQALKRKNILYSFLIGCVFWGIAAVILISNLDSIQAYFAKPVNFNNLKAEDIKEGLRVKADIYLIYDYYAYYEEDGKTTMKEYLIPVGDSEYMGMVCGGTYMYTADSNMELYWDYLDGKDVSADSVQTMQLEGTIMPITGESLQLYNKYIDEMQMTEEDEQYFLPYALMVDYLGDSPGDDLILSIIFFVFMVIVGIAMFVINISDSNIKELESYCAAKGDKQMQLERIEQFYEGGTAVCNIRIDSEYFMAVKSARVFFAEVTDLLWVYPNVTQHSVNMIPTGKTYALMVRTVDGRKLQIPMKNKAALEEAMAYVAENLPYLYYGFDDNTHNFYKNSRQQMAEHVALRRQQFFEASAMLDAEEDANEEE